MSRTSTRRRRRRAALALAAGLTGSLLSLSALPAHAADVPRPLGPSVPHTPKRAPDAGRDKLGARDRTLLQKAESKKRKNVTVLLATTEGGTEKARAAITELGGHVGAFKDKLGYVRATVPTGKVEALTALSSVRAVDLDETYKIPDPSPVTSADKKQGAPSAGDDAPAAPGKSTPADNPYLPVGDIGATDFTADHPTWDGRGVTVGVLDTGVDLSHPALRTTTTGAPKIKNWVTATDPVTDSDPTWLEMRLKVTASGGTFRYGGVTYNAPGDGAYEFQLFDEDGTWGSELAGDVNRDGDYKDSFGVLYRKSDHAVWVDSDLDHTFAADEIVKPYAQSGSWGHFGTDDPDTGVVESVPFTVEHRDDVDLSARGGSSVGKTADFVNIGIVSGAHGTHVAGIIAGHGLFGGTMDGAAPGARIVSERVCLFASGCTAYALAEGMIDAVVDQHVDVVNLSIGGLPALNDGSNVRSVLYNRLIDTYGVQIVSSAGNDGPGMNTVSDPAVSDQVLAVGASVGKDTWWADYGSKVTARQSLFPFSARGPREDGGMKPEIVAPGAAVSSIPTWLAGEGVPQTGYELPAGYGMFNGTSMASPQATGAVALLLSAAADTGRSPAPAELRTALTSSARFLDDQPAYAQGAGLVDVPAAWRLLAERGGGPTAYGVRAPVCTVLAGLLATPKQGTGVYNRCAPGDGGQEVGRTKRYAVELTRTAGSGSGVARLSWLGDDGTFSAPHTVRLAAGAATTITVQAKAATAGAHSALLRVDDPTTPGVDRLVPVTVVAAARPAAPSYAVTDRDAVDRNATRSVFVSVPEGAAALQVDLGGISGDSQTRFLAIDPQGMPAEDTAASRCYTGSSNSDDCDPDTRTYRRPMPGVWEVQVDARRTSPLLSNPYRLTTTVQGAALDPASSVVDEAAVHAPTERTFTAVNRFAPVTAHAEGGALGALSTAHPTLTDHQVTSKTVTVPRDATRLEVTLGNAADADADLDLYLVAQSGALVASSTNGGARESLTVEDPKPGYYGLVVAGTDIPSGSTTFDIQDTLFSTSLGSVTVDDGKPVRLASGASTRISGRIVADTAPPSGTRLVGRFSLASDTGTPLGSADVLLGKVTQPTVEVTGSFGPAVAFGLDDAGRVAGSQQISGVSRPIRWDPARGVTVLQDDGARSGYVLGQSAGNGWAVGQLTVAEGTRGGVWDADGDLTVLPLPTWETYRFDRAFAVNDAGTVVGNATGTVKNPATGGTTEVNDPFVWTRQDGFRHLPHLTDSRQLTEPLALNNDGVVVGHSTKDGKRRAVRWSADGTITDLGTLPGMADSYARAVNSAGEIVGSSGDDAFVLKPGGTMTRLPDFGFDAHALDVNDAGWIVGTAETAPDDTTAVVWDPQGHMYALDAMVDTEHWAPTEGVGINNRGEVAFYALDRKAGGTTKVLVAELPS
ncbi:S8 family serine peptidase [Streptomyces sp. VRA16 Mangrove soil]|uniref:S8 family serine peptidase n=1 Tax=Streptomyces sp. VRA16 Mangrove soil TaxID=2817434 RepID=UPI001A9FAE0A|nr:S8 family serine peptidase [Streptomyces sp. VRA16 Mangrove soil]MBO1329978.1 S8 family serine peptidase [Streptomyces sp. VRA16 Mangrove soil]